MAFCIMDLVVGTLEYASEVQLLTGWVHHVVYFCIVGVMVATHTTNTFVLMCICEVPTFILALGRIHKPARADVAFGVTFIATRVLYYAMVFAKGLLEGAPTALVVVSGLVLLLHLSWMRDWIAGMRRRSKGRDGSAASATLGN